ncbi:hypothetical protein BDZ97DRAFT_1915717 [Flammula alnicola]|nr:hypothetical protein BDZ97DRAFT_1915717 [Flammula alnicola]
MDQRRFGADLYQNHHPHESNNDYQQYDHLREYQNSRQINSNNNLHQAPGPPTIDYLNHPLHARAHPRVGLSGPSNIEKPPSQSADHPPMALIHTQATTRRHEEEHDNENRPPKKPKIHSENEAQAAMPRSRSHFNHSPSGVQQRARTYDHPPHSLYKQTDHHRHPHSPPYHYEDSRPQYHSGYAVAGPSHQPIYQQRDDYRNKYFDDREDQ